MATQQRIIGQVVIAWIFLTQQTCLLPVDSFSTPTHVLRSTTRPGRGHRGALSFVPGRQRLDHAPGRPASASSATDTDTVSSQSPTSVAGDAPTGAEEEEEKFDMPWSDVQEWALKDNLAKFTVLLPPPVAGGQPKRYAMWRTLTREVPELAGYPIPFLLQMHQRTAKKEGGTTPRETPGFLPMVDDFAFTPEGGIVGRAYGLPGIADGTRIQTTALMAAATSVPLGYVTTQGDPTSPNDAGVSYELGACASSSVSALDASASSAAAAARRSVGAGAVASAQQAANLANDVAATGAGLLSDAEANKDLAYLGGATALLLASATAVGMLSHHLTVNVFWV